MRKTSLLLSIALLIGFSLPSTKANSQEFLAPVPAGSSHNQVNGPGFPYRVDDPEKNTKTDALYIKFFKHHPWDEGQNYSTTSIITADEAMGYVDDLAAVPGLKASLNLSDISLMLDKMILEAFPPGEMPEPLSSMHGFCPEPLKIKGLTGTDYELVFECDATVFPDPNHINIGDRQFEIADIRNTLNADEFTTLLGTSPLLPNIIADARENTSPYDPNNYPSTIIANPPFVWNDPAGLPLDDAYSQVIAYGVADLDQGMVTASYDPLQVFNKIRMTLINKDAGRVIASRYISEPFGADADIFNFLSSHMSPLIFYRKDSRLRLSGYSSWQFGTYDMRADRGESDFFMRLPIEDIVREDLIEGDVAERMGVVGAPRRPGEDFVWKGLMGLNFNPIDVVSIKNGAKTYLAVVNQATLGSVNQCMRADDGRCAIGLGGRTYKWRQILHSIEGDLTGERLPNDVVSYVTFWEQKCPWTNDPSASPLDGHNCTDNPNEAFDPVHFSLIGQNPYSADVLKDTIAGGYREFLVVAAGDADTGYFIYKIAPESTTDKDVLFLKDYFGDGSIRRTPGILGEPFRINPPPDETSAPYVIKAGNFNGDACGDLALTWRGVQAVPAKPILGAHFQNHYGDNVRFQMNSTSPVMFSDIITIYLGVERDGKCVFDDSSKLQLQARPGVEIAKPQIAAIALFDADHDGYDDIWAGNLNPMPTAEEGKCSAYAYHYKVDLTHPISPGSSYELIRVGFADTDTCPSPPDDNGAYLAKVATGAEAEGRIMRAGVGALNFDSNGNIAAVIGLPLMLPSFGCPKFGNELDVMDNFVVSSMPEELMAINYDRAGGGRYRVDGNIVPMRCAPPPPLDLVLPRLIIEPIPPAEGDRAERGGGGGGIGGERRAVPGGGGGGGGMAVPFCLAPVDGPNCCSACDSPEFLVICRDFCAVPDNARIYAEMCRRVGACPGAMLTLPKDKFFAENPQGDGTSSDGEGRSDFAWNKFANTLDNLLFKDALAQVAPSKFRLPRGQVMPGKREITVVIKKPAPIVPGISPISAGAIEPDAPCIECPSGESCPCNSPCVPEIGSPPYTTCEMPDEPYTVMKCSGGSSEAAMKSISEFNKFIREAVRRGGGEPAENDFFCEAGYGTMKVQVSVPGGAAPGLDVSALTGLNPNVVGNIGQAALIQYKGTRPVDFTQVRELPTTANLTPQATILMPVSADVAASISFPEKTMGQKGMMMLSTDLSSAVSYASTFNPALSNAIPASTDLVTSIASLPENVFQFNNVIRWQMTAASQAKGAGLGVAVNNIDVTLQPFMCSWSNACPQSEAFQSENMFAKIDPKKVLNLAEENGAQCKNGICPPEFFEKLGWPKYQSYSFALVQSRVAKTGDPLDTNQTPFSFGGSFPMEFAKGGGCKCDMTATPYDTNEIVFFISIAAIVLAALVLVRFRKSA